MSESTIISGNPTPDEAAAVLAAVALVLDEERRRRPEPGDGRALPAWVRLGRLAAPDIPRSD